LNFFKLFDITLHIPNVVGTLICITE